MSLHLHTIKDNAFQNMGDNKQDGDTLTGHITIWYTLIVPSNILDSTSVLL